MGDKTDLALLLARKARFPYDSDVAARREIERRLADVARREGIIVYSDLVKGIGFNIPNVQGGQTICLGVPDWSDLHRLILGNYLGRVSCDTYELGGFLAAAVAVSKVTYEPSEGFRSLLEDLGLVGSKKDAACTAIWLNHLRLTYQWAAVHPEWASA